MSTNVVASLGVATPAAAGTPVATVTVGTPTAPLSAEEKRTQGLRNLSDKISSDLKAKLAAILAQQDALIAQVKMTMELNINAPARRAKTPAGTEGKTAKSPAGASQNGAKGISNSLLYFRHVMKTDQKRWEQYISTYAAAYQAALAAPAVVKKSPTKDSDPADFRYTVAHSMWASLPDTEKAAFKQELASYNAKIAESAADHQIGDASVHETAI